MPELAPYATAKWASAVVGIILLLVLWIAIDGHRQPALLLDMAAVLLTNAFSHTWGTIKTRQYSPGLTTGLLLCTPVAVYTVLRVHWQGVLTWGLLTEALFVSFLVGLAPLASLKITASFIKNRTKKGVAG